jgi:hypothetical protein
MILSIMAKHCSAECHICHVSFMLRVSLRLTITCKAFMLGVIMLNVVVLSVIMLSVVALKGE